MSVSRARSCLDGQGKKGNEAIVREGQTTSHRPAPSGHSDEFRAVRRAWSSTGGTTSANGSDRLRDFESGPERPRPLLARAPSVKTAAFIADNTKLLPRPQQRAKNNHKRIMPCRLLQRVVGSAFDVRRALLQRRRLVRQVLERGNRQGRRWASGNVCWPGRPTNAAPPRKARLGHLVAFAVHARRTNSGRSSDT